METLKTPEEEVFNSWITNLSYGYDSRDAELISYGTMLDVFGALDSAESAVIMGILDRNISQGQVGRNESLNKVHDPLTVSENELTDHLPWKELNRALDYLSEPVERDRVGNYPGGRIVDYEDGTVKLPHGVLVDLADIMVESSAEIVESRSQLSRREEIDRLREGEELPTDQYHFHGHFVGEPGLMEKKESGGLLNWFRWLFTGEYSREVYRWTGGPVVEELYDAVGPEGSLKVVESDDGISVSVQDG